jgi:hypothetical protein
MCSRWPGARKLRNKILLLLVQTPRGNAGILFYTKYLSFLSGCANNQELLRVAVSIAIHACRLYVAVSS